ncbi:hypothetical protein McpSp1_07940 [Methanocorpusculaceae archaeon Sp1]|nr:hypothetical protein [Methanocorpusculaceae archaeon Sp1]
MSGHREIILKLNKNILYSLHTIYIRNIMRKKILSNPVINRILCYAPDFSYIILRYWRSFNNINNYQYRAHEKSYCPFCEKWSYFLPAGSPPRIGAICPFCGLRERHRELYDIYQEFFSSRMDGKFVVYHMAPEKGIYDYILKQKNIHYITGDFAPENFPFAKKCRYIDATSMPFENESIDVILSNHVMEHIPNESLFLQEMYRVLKNDGTIFLTIPFFKDQKITLENEKFNTNELRTKYYGQSDHVRKYGMDVFERLERYFSIKYHDDPSSDGMDNGGCFILTK